MNLIKEKILTLPIPLNGFNLFKVNNTFWGKGSKGETVFGIESNNCVLTPLTQTTKYIKLYINYSFTCIIDNSQISKKLSLYVLNTSEEKLVDLFIRICSSMPEKPTEKILYDNFVDLKNLFTNQTRPSNIELQGMFGELYTIYYFKKYYDIDISTKYQKEQKRKFDFSITNIKKVEIKSTIKPDRIHHFLKEQLDSERYDIKIVSLLLQKDDEGLSLKNLVEKCKELFSTYLQIVIYIELMIKNISDEELDSIRFNESYIKDNLKIYDSVIVPKIHEKTRDGVFNIEFDSDLTNISNISIDDFKLWL